MAIAIDFGITNGKQSDKDSLHSLDLKNNQYIQALEAVVPIV